MTDKIKSAIENLKEMYPKTVKMIDGRYTGGFDDYESEKGKSITLAIRSLQAWEEVLNQLQEWKNNAQNEHEQKISYAYFSAIKIINQHLSEIKE